MTKRWALLFTGLLLAAGAPAGGGQEPVDVSRLGPQVGETVPDFTLPDQDGVERSLQSLLGPKGAVVMFNRSADW